MNTYTKSLTCGVSRESTGWGAGTGNVVQAEAVTPPHRVGTGEIESWTLL